MTRDQCCGHSFRPCGGRIAAKAITISTVGLVPVILRITRQRRPYRLIVSMTSAIDDIRRSLLPVAAAWSVAELAAAVPHVSNLRSAGASRSPGLSLAE